MPTTSNETTSSLTITQDESPLERSIKFGILLALEPPSIICNSLLVYYLISEKRLRQAIHHHVILLLLMVTLFTNVAELPRLLHYLRLGYVTPQTASSCLIWQWLDFVLFAKENWLMMWASFERHLLVFHGHLFNTQKGRLFIHYCPLAFIILYLNIFYIVVVFFHPCPRAFDYDSILCGYPCFTHDYKLALFDLFFHGWMAIFLIIVFSSTLIIRVLYSKRTHMQQQHQWRRYRRMVIQLLSISFMYLTCMGPYSALEIIDNAVGLSSTANYVKGHYLLYMYWLITLCLPFTCIGCLPEVTSKIRLELYKLLKRKNSVAPCPSIVH